MKHVIVGTAGHIDHGKTTLIRALTNKDTDRLKEEQKRGISIELGFTYFDLPSGKRAGIIDVPGHEKFIKNMLAGVMGIDIVLLVIAADEGVMPQTSEHLAILDLLGIDKGFIVLTKADLVEKEWIELVEEDIRESIKGSFLENSPIIPVSSVTKEGIGEVTKLIDELAQEVEMKEVDDTPRLPVDRVFSISGFGTVVTGTLLSGEFNVGDEVEIFPRENIGRIRSLQVHDEDVSTASAGQRVAINISGIKKTDVERGDVIAPINSMKKTMMLDTKVKLIENMDRPIENRTRLRLYIGSKEVLCRIVLLDRDVLEPGEEAYAQLRLEEETVAKRGDRFILRFYSPMYTIGGGKVLESNPNKKKRFDEKVLEELKIKEEGDSIDIIERIVLDNSKSFPTIKEIATTTGILEENVKKDIEVLANKDKLILFNLTREVYIIHREYFDLLRENILDELEKFHKKYPLRAGMSKEEIRSKFLRNANPRVGDRFIELLAEMDYIDKNMENVHTKGFEIRYSEVQSKIKEEIIGLYISNKFMPPKKEDLYQKISYNKDEVEQVLNALISNGDIIQLNPEIYLYKSSYEEARSILIDYLNKNQSIVVAEYRDILDTNRKVALALLEYFDQEKITKRDGDKRVLF